MATELAVGYVSIVPETSKVGPGIEKSLAESASTIAKFGSVMGSELGKGIADGMGSGMADAISSSKGVQAGSRLAERIGQGMREGLSNQRIDPPADILTRFGDFGRRAGSKFANEFGVETATFGQKSSKKFFDEFRTTSERVGAISGLVIGKTVGAGIAAGMVTSGAAKGLAGWFGVGGGFFKDIAAGGMAAARGIGSKIGGVLHSAIRGALLSTGIGAVIGSVGGLGGFLFGGFERLQKLDTARVQLSQMGKSAQEVASIMADVKSVVEGTPVSLDAAFGVVNIALASGVKAGAELKQYLTDIADAAGKGGVKFEEMADIFNSVLTNGSLQGDDINRFQNRMIPIQQWIQETYRINADTFAKMQHDGEISMSMVQKAVEDHAKGMASALTSTLPGAIDQTQTAFKRLSASVISTFLTGGKSGDELAPIKGMFENLTNKLDDLNSWVLSHQHTIRQFFADIAKGATEAGKVALQWAALMMDAWARLFSGVKTELIDPLEKLSRVWGNIQNLGGLVHTKDGDNALKFADSMRQIGDTLTTAEDGASKVGNEIRGWIPTLDKLPGNAQKWADQVRDVSTAAREVGAELKVLEDGKTIVLKDNSQEVIDNINKVNFDIKHLEDGSVQIIPKTEKGEKIVNDFLAEQNRKKIEPAVEPNLTPGTLAIQQWLKVMSSSSVEIPVSVTPTFENMMLPEGGLPGAPGAASPAMPSSGGSGVGAAGMILGNMATGTGLPTTITGSFGGSKAGGGTGTKNFPQRFGGNGFPMTAVEPLPASARAGAEGWRPVVRAALQQVAGQYGITNLQAYENDIIGQINLESRGNPNIDNLNDSNGRGGRQQVFGLGQFLPSTFAAHNITGGDIHNGTAQIYAMIDYTAKKYGVVPGGGVAWPQGIGYVHNAGYSSGGGVSGPGTATSDSIAAWLSSGEHVLTAADVQAMGGQDAVYAFRSALHRGTGGPIPQTTSDWTPGINDDDNQMVNPHVSDVEAQRKTNTGIYNPSIPGHFDSGKGFDWGIQSAGQGVSDVPGNFNPNLILDPSTVDYSPPGKSFIPFTSPEFTKMLKQLQGDPTSDEGRNKLSDSFWEQWVNPPGGGTPYLQYIGTGHFAGGGATDDQLTQIDPNAMTSPGQPVPNPEPPPLPPAGDMVGMGSVDPNTSVHGTAQGAPPGPPITPMDAAAMTASSDQPQYGMDFLRSVFVPAEAANSGKAGSGSLAKFWNLGNSVVGGLLDTGASIAQTAVSAAIAAGAASGTFGAAAPAAPVGASAAGYGIQLAANLGKTISSYWFGLAGILSDAAVEQLFPFGAPRWLGYDYTQFIPQTQILSAGTSTLEKMANDAITKAINPQGQPGQPGSPPNGASPAGAPGASGPVNPSTMPGAQQPLPPPPDPTSLLTPPTPASGPSAETTLPPPPAPTPVTPIESLMGYDDGGMLPPGGMGINMTGRPEPVLTPQQWDAIMASSSSPAQTAPLVQNLYAQDMQDAIRQLEAVKRRDMMQYAGRS